MTRLSADDKPKRLPYLAVVSAVVLAAGLFFDAERIWSNLFVGAFLLLTIGLGGTLFIALTNVTGASWHVAFRRVPEAMAMIVPFAGAAILAVLALRMRQYGWNHGSGEVGTFWFKELWLTPSFWLIRSMAYIVIWSLLGGWIVLRSRKQDTSPANAELLHRGQIQLSAVFLVAYALTFSLASADWMMALEPMWFSTMWGVYNFSGMILAALAVIVILCLQLSAPGKPLHSHFHDEHLHDLGKLLIGFSCFWMYIWFSQYMLIWYANIPEETSYFVTRTRGPWGPIVVASIVVNWVAPFFVLLSRPAKRNRTVMMRVAIVLLVGRWLDLYLMVFPSVLGDAPVFGVWEIAALCLTVCAGQFLLRRSFKSAAPIPSHDVYLAQSLHYHT